jgi:hypothetical protein
VRPFSLDHVAFNGHMINLAVILSSLSIVLKISIGAFGDGVDCTMGG